MGYIESIRELVGSSPLILVRPSVIVINPQAEILLVQYVNNVWGVPGGLMELGESVEECAIREVKEEIGLTLKSLQLIGVFSGKELYTKLRNGHEYYNVVIGYACTEFEGEIQPDGVEVLAAQFFSMKDLPENTDPFIKNKLKESDGHIQRILQATR
ncbi:DNA mismatch repair protein MutT [Paenibacillus selenitireducens]|uniref:DNA mismatch repair protein MutT n=1 Tax=Paenibacillus selenitireducens TaxID=1324314 RepID=A0A1T2X235_9BACL|nr:NUDIX domain-containing protein [Paenibacillus selenitireducens]OPA73776.1 DNA mismatch repair protein MutT [Paenibacillus selenitireducens]